VERGRRFCCSLRRASEERQSACEQKNDSRQKIGTAQVWSPSAGG
jgi:hypothetical protein